MICDYTPLLGAFDGTFLDDSGKPAFNTGGGVQALAFMKASLDEGLSNPASTESLEEDVRKTFSSGQAALALNWTYMYGLANDPAGVRRGRQGRHRSRPLRGPGAAAPA